MKKLYWVSTLFIAAMLTLSAASYLFHEGTIVGVRALGFPDFFRLQLAVLKLGAALILVVPNFPSRVKEWAYAGVGLFIVTAIVAHVAHEDSWVLTLINIVFLAVLAASNASRPTCPCRRS